MILFFSLLFSFSLANATDSEFFFKNILHEDIRDAQLISEFEDLYKKLEQQKPVKLKPFLKSVKDRSIFSDIHAPLSYLSSSLTNPKNCFKNKTFSILNRTISKYCALTIIDKGFHNFREKDLTTYVSMNIEDFNRYSKRFYKQVKKLKKASQTKVRTKIEDYYINYNKKVSRNYTKTMYVSKRMKSYIAKREKENSTYSTIRRSIRKAFKKDQLITVYSNIKKLWKNSTENLVKKISDVTLSYTRDFISKKKYKLAYNSIALLRKNNPLYKKSEVLFIEAWLEISQNKFSNAKLVFEKNKTINIKNHSKLSYWYAQTLEKTSRTSEALEIYKETIHAHPLSYYSVLSFKRIAKLKNLDHATKLLQTENNQLLNKNTMHAIRSDKKTIKLINKFYNWGKSDIGFLSSYFEKALEDKITEISNPNEANIVTSYIYNKNNHHLKAFMVLYKAIEAKKVDVNIGVLKLLFPIEHQEIIKKETITKNLYTQVISLIRQESAFNPLAKSPVGAMGVMQLMPATARRFKKVKRNKLFTPSINIEIGVKYFKKLMKRFDNNMIYSLAAYNAGEHRVDRWKKKIFSFSDQRYNIENIPYNETRKYVKLILRNVFFYEVLYGDVKTSTPDLKKVFNTKIY